MGGRVTKSIWTGVPLVLAWIMVTACGSGAGIVAGPKETGDLSGGADSTAPDGGGPSVPSRLVSFGPNLNVAFDPNGYPTTMDALYVHYDLTWDSGHLVRAIATTTQGGTRRGTFTYATDRVVGMTVDRGTDVSGDPSKTSVLDYTPTGALSRWTIGRNQAGYTYDANGWLVGIAFSPARPGDSASDVFAYDANGCPTSTKENGASFTYSYVNGRLSTYAGPRGVSSADVIYDVEGRIVSFSGTGSSFRPLIYEDGEARGLDLFPGHFNGGFVYGYPAHAELFRLDGQCDPTLRSQATITSLVLRTLPSYGDP